MDGPFYSWVIQFFTTWGITFFPCPLTPLLVSGTKLQTWSSIRTCE